MLNTKDFLTLLKNNGISFFSGVPDSLLKDICAYITSSTSDNQHIMSANEGGAVALGVGYHLATGKIPLIYMQNSGLGNVVNPLLSLADREVYSIPMMLLIGWRGEPGRKDEPQHIKQGRVMLGLLESMEIPYEILGPEMDDASDAIKKAMTYFKKNSGPYALVVRKGTFEPYKLTDASKQPYTMKREDAIKLIIDQLDSNDIIVSTTGMASRELYECREEQGHGHEGDFLTVGSMGHSSQIALGIAVQSKDRQVYCLDGDGSLLMHMGAMAINGVQRCSNIHHILLNNGAHDSVGGQPTVGFDVDFQMIARGAGYQAVLKAESKEEISNCMSILKKSQGPTFLEIRVNKGSRKDLGRPTKTPIKNKEEFIGFLRKRSGDLKGKVVDL